MGKLIIARHQESEWNKLGKWTGKRDRHLTNLGFEKSEDMGLLIKDINIDYAFASMQVRSIETLSCMLNVCNFLNVPTEHSSALNERDYGDYTGKDKEEMEKILGEEEFKKLRRGWDYPIPNGESLKMVYDRVIPFYMNHILPKVNEDKNVLVVGHGNSMRSLIKYIENISDEDIANVEFPFNKVFVYELDKDGKMKSKEIKDSETNIKNSRSNIPEIIVTFGPKISEEEKLKQIIMSGVKVFRFNTSWLDLKNEGKEIDYLKKISADLNSDIKIIIDLSGPRVQKENGHTFNKDLVVPTQEDYEFIKLGINNNVDYFAISFVKDENEVDLYKKVIKEQNGNQKIISKIERQEAVDNLSQLIEISDAVMVARGDLGDNLPIEKVPFIQEEIIKKSKASNKPVIVATQMLYSMVKNSTPTRAEVSDIASAVTEGADYLMLSDETTIGDFPTESVSVMKRVISESIQHVNNININHL